MDRSALLRAADVAGVRAHDARGSLQHTAPSAPSKLVANPDDLVTRALAILTEDHKLSHQTQFSQAPNIARESGTQSPDLKLQRPVLSNGTECPLLIRYFDVQCLVATFPTDLNRAAELLKGTGLYRITDIGPYNEVGLTVVARVPGDPIPGNYVINLPVTTAVANRAGREIWGYNKFVAAIDVCWCSTPTRFRPCYSRAGLSKPEKSVGYSSSAAAEPAFRFPAEAPAVRRRSRTCRAAPWSGLCPRSGSGACRPRAAASADRPRCRGARCRE
jgi:hypothetical protein